MKKLNEILGTEFPIIQGGMANIATGEFAAACSNAGALGVIGTGGMLDAGLLRRQIQICKDLTDRPFGVNLMLMNPCAGEMAKVIVEEGVQVVTTGAGNPGKYIPAWKEAGIKVLPVVAAVVLAKRLHPRQSAEGVHLPAGKQGVPHPRKLQTGDFKGQGQRHSGYRAVCGRSGAVSEKQDDPGVSGFGKRGGHSGGAGARHIGRPPPGGV